MKSRNIPAFRHASSPQIQRFEESGCTSATLLMWTVVLVLFSAGCGLFDDDEDGVSARSDGLRVIVENDSGDRIYYALFGRELATLIDWIPHLDESRSVAPRSSRSILHADIMKADDETEAIFYWWKADIRDGERVPGTLTSTIIDL